MQCPVLPLQRHWGLRVLPSSLPLHTSPLPVSRVAPSHLSCTCRFLSFHKSSKYFLLFSIFLSWSPNSSNSSASLIPWISLMPPSPRQSVALWPTGHVINKNKRYNWCRIIDDRKIEIIFCLDGNDGLSYFANHFYRVLPVTLEWWQQSSVR